MNFTRTNKSVTTKWFVKNLESIKYDRLLQRNYVWKEHQQNELIDTYLRDYTVPPMYVRDTGDKHFWVLDGQQRITTTIKFINDEFALSKTFGEVKGIDLSGKKFSELPKEMQDEIKDYSFLVYVFKDMTDDDVKEQFKKLNYGSSLNKAELLRSTTNIDVMKFIKSIADVPFFANSIKISDNARNKLVDEELIRQIILLVMKNEPVGIGSKEYNNHNEELNQNGIPGEVKEIIQEVATYLNQALPAQEMYLKKVNIPMIFMTAKQAVSEDVSPEKFGGFIQHFFNGKNKKAIRYKYENACGDKSASKEKVKIRLEEMMDEYKESISNVSDYKKPEPKVSTGKRGRPSTKQEPEQHVTPQDGTRQELMQEQEQTLGDDLNTVESELEIQDDCQLGYDGNEDGIDREEYQDQEVVM